MSLQKYVSQLLSGSELSFRDLAKRGGINHSSIQDIANGKTKNPGPEILLGVARAFKIDPTDLLLAASGKNPQESETILKDHVVGTLIEALEKISPGAASQTLSIEPSNLTDQQLQEALKAKFPIEKDRVRFVKSTLAPKSFGSKLEDFANDWLDKCTPESLNVEFITKDGKSYIKINED